PCVHTMFSSGLISTQIFPLPLEVFNLITRFPFEFIYGALSLDFQLKGKRIRHKHTWEDGFRAFEGLGTEKEKAYALGFLTHLAADIGAHHFFIPRIMKTPYGEKRLRHLMWEVRVDRWFARRYSGLASYTIAQGHLLCDEALLGEGELIKRGLYHVKKGVYRNGLMLNSLLPHMGPIWHRHRDIRHKMICAYEGLLISRQAILAVLWEGRRAWPLKFDPMGPGEGRWGE
ncbi:MAG: zinc dependent phospholipase C family protein, partial [Desulfatiglandales bacterium]